MPTWVAMAVYLVSVLHFSPLQLVLMGTAMEAAVFLCEVPTGSATTRPERWARMTGSTARVMFSGPNRLVSTCARKSSGLISSKNPA